MSMLLLLPPPPPLLPLLPLQLPLKTCTVAVKRGPCEVGFSAWRLSQRYASDRAILGNTEFSIYHPWTEFNRH
jgi:hypothetical protein